MTTANSNRSKIEEIKISYNLGKITREEAKALASPIINSVNAKAEELSKKYGFSKSHGKVNFNSLMR